MHLRCTICKTKYPLDPRRFRCDCGEIVGVESTPVFDPAQVVPGDLTLWRYRHALPLPEGAAPVSLGEGMTPLVASEWDGLPILLKCEYLNPTGSFKDRGTTVLATALAAAGISQVVEDSSGNAGASLAAYAARAGINASIYVPTHSSPVKQAQIAAYGAQIVPVPGPRSKTARAVLEAVNQGTAYASHVYHPLIHHGMKTAAFELYEQIAAGGARLIAPSAPSPDAIVLPVGHGSLLLGLAKGFLELQKAGCVDGLPRIYGVQAETCAPLATAWAQSAEEAVPVDEGDTIAEGVRIAAPARGRAILEAVRQSGGAILPVADKDTVAAQRRLAHRGFYVEPTSAVALAALSKLRDQLGGTTVVILTGSGFKSPP